MSWQGVNSDTMLANVRDCTKMLNEKLKTQTSKKKLEKWLREYAYFPNW
jgi:hypothetical protein